MARICGSCGNEAQEVARFCASCGAALAPAGALPKERKLATALFVDVVGSTSLAEREDPEVVQALLGTIFGRAASEIHARGGLVEKYIGDAILAVFGVPSVHEDDPERAVLAAMAVQAAVADLNHSFAAAGRPELAVRIGLESGEVLVDMERAHGPRHRMLTGDAVNTAARLEQVARPGRVVVGPIAHEATRDRMEYAELAPVELKGKAARVPSWEVLRPRAHPSGERAPLRLEASLIGRAKELARLEDELERVRTEGRPRLVTVVGPAGIGKSRLAHELVAAIAHRRDPVAIRKGRCLAYGNVSYSALAEAVKAECGIFDDDTPESMRRKASAAVERLGGRPDLVPHMEALIGTGTEPGRDSAVDRRFGREDLFDAWRRILERMAVRSPLVLVLEDLHWADDGLLDFVDHVAVWAEGPILVLGLARPELLERRPSWGDGTGAGEVVVLDPLTANEAEGLLADLLAARLPDDVGRMVREAAAGNPLFCEEIARMLVDHGAIRAGEPGRLVLTGPIASIEVPRSIQALLAARLDSLPSPEKAALQGAAVIGRTFWDGALEQLSGVAQDRLTDVLDRLQAKGLIVPNEPSTLSGEREYAFRHILIRDVAYDSLPKAVRVDRHCATAHWAQAHAGHRTDEIAELLATHHLQALHWLDDLGESNGRRREVEEEGYRWSRAAGERARRLWQQREAVRWLRAALDLGARTGRGNAELASLWESYALASDGIATIPDVVHAWEEALARYVRAGRAGDVGRVEASIAHACLWSGNEGATRRIARRAVDRLEPIGESVDLGFALFVLGRHLIERGDVDRAEPLLRRAKAIAGRVGDRSTEANAAISLGWTLNARRRGDETVPLFDEALAVARGAGDLALLLDALEAVLSAAIEIQGDYPRAERLCREAVGVARRAGNLQKLARAQINLGYLLGEQGRLAEADEPLEASMAAATAVGDPTMIASVHGVVAVHRCLQGRLDEAQAAFEARRATFTQAQLGKITYVEEFDGLIGSYLAIGRGRDGEAADILTEANRRVSDERLSVWEGQILLLECIKVLVRLGRAAEAVAVRDRLALLASSNVPPRAFLAWADGLLASDPATALDRLEEAVARFEALGRRIDMGRSLLDVADTEGRLGIDARPAMVRGQAILEACGAQLFLS